MQEGKEKPKIEREREIKLELKGIKAGNKTIYKSIYYLLECGSNDGTPRREGVLNRFLAYGPFPGPFVSVGTPNYNTIGGHTGLRMVGINMNTRNWE